MTVQRMRTLHLTQSVQSTLTNKWINPRRSEVYRKIRKRGVPRSDKDDVPHYANGGECSVQWSVSDGKEEAVRMKRTDCSSLGALFGQP